MKRFTEIDHTGDIAFRVSGKDLKELFENAAVALYSHIVDIERVREKKTFTVQVSANDESELLINWLNELNYITETRLYVFSSFVVEEVKPAFLTGTIRGEKYNYLRHGPFREIKAVTFSNNVINKNHNDLNIDIICDI